MQRDRHPIDVGRALSIAVIGSIVTAIYRANLHLAGIPAGLASKARGSFALAIHAGGPLRISASSAFTDGIHTGLLYAAGTALLAAITVTVLLPGDLRRRHLAGSEAHEDREDQAWSQSTSSGYRVPSAPAAAAAQQRS